MRFSRLTPSAMVLGCLVGTLAMASSVLAAGQLGGQSIAMDKVAHRQLRRTVNTQDLLIPDFATEQDYLAWEISQHDFSVLSTDWLEAVVEGIDTVYGLQLDGVRKAEAVQYLAHSPLEEITVPRKTQLYNGPFVFPQSQTRGSLPRLNLRAGAAWTSIVMPIGVPLPGFGRFPPTFNLIEDPYDFAKIYGSNKGAIDIIRSKAVVLEVGGQPICILGLDTVGVTAEIHEALATELAARGIPIGMDQLLITATHTHSGPGALTQTPAWQLITVDLYDARVFDMMLEAIADSVELAYGRLEPAKLGVAQRNEPTLDIQSNRRDDPNMVDRELGVIRVDRASDDTAIAVLFNLAVHPICYGQDNLYFTADLSGYAERFVEAQLGHGCVAVHVNGAEGDISPRIKGSTAGAKLMGETLGQYALDLRRNAVTEAQIGMQMRSQEFAFPPPYLRPAGLEDSLPLGLTIPLTGLFQDRAIFTALRINDDTIITTIPGEPITKLGLQVKDACRQWGFTNAMVFGLAQNHLSYFVDEQEYWQGGYEAGACMFGPEAGTVVVGYALDVADNLVP